MINSNTGIRTLNGYTHWIADNVDHNLVTLDGKRTFHGIGRMFYL